MPPPHHPAPPPRGSSARPPTGPLPAVLLARELAPAAVQAEASSGRLERVRPGAYRRVPPTSASPPGVPAAAARELALARIAAVGRQLRTPFWFSHESAALIWGCPLWTAPTATHIIQTVRPSHHGEPALTRHIMELAQADRQERRGVPVTSLERAAVDCLRQLTPREALVLADGALRLGADRDALRARLDALAGGRGVVGARTVLDLADARAESPWETFVRYLLLRHGLPRPDLQIPVLTRLGWFWSDLGWPAWRLLIEVDGYVKYASSEDPARVVFEEKRRQDAITEEGWSVLRVTPGDTRGAQDLIGRVHARLPPVATARLTPVRGW
ncbi:hypothetical protein [Pengzhenrongella sicca]|uniref:DUF559 domain-containing protein n=1 Tax=Pengzhenrongella sicca TaxID=2819238 RepID=A0A8A4ZDY7_9MICO|nr:hypothetical protein [Pengzhenrongella sicca]QTE29239.1 hypothetical protein J4E96_18475 [Pengzhenrongella sicca]